MRFIFHFLMNSIICVTQRDAAAAASRRRDDGRDEATGQDKAAGEEEAGEDNGAAAALPLLLLLLLLPLPTLAASNGSVAGQRQRVVADMHLGEDSAADDEDDGAPAQAAAVGVRLSGSERGGLLRHRSAPFLRTAPRRRRVFRRSPSLCCRRR